MNILVAPLENFIIGEKTSFSAEEAAGQTILSCENGAHFVANDYVVLGEIGSEIAEIRQISSISADLTTITITAATNFKHVKDSAITQLKFNQRKFYRSSTESGTFSHIAIEGSPIDIQVDSPEGTLFEDSSGVSTSWYKATYYNATTGEETSLSSAVAAQAGDSDDYTSIFKIKSEAGFEDNDFISSEIAGRYRDEAQAQVDGTVVMTYSLPFSSIPKLITHITTLLAAGLLLKKEYGVTNDTDISQSGQSKIERAEELLRKIVEGELLLVDSSGSTLSKKSSAKVSGSNTYSSTKKDKGELFNLYDENFKCTDPDDETASSERVAGVFETNSKWSQK